MFDPISLVMGVLSLFGGKPEKTNNTKPVAVNKEDLIKRLSMTDATSQSTQSNGNVQGNNGQSLNPTSATSASSTGDSNKSSTSAKPTSKASNVASNARFS